MSLRRPRKDRGLESQHGSFRRAFASPSKRDAPPPDNYGKKVKGDDRVAQASEQDVRKGLEQRAAATKADHARTAGMFTKRNSEVLYSKSDGAGAVRGCGRGWIVAVTKRNLYYLSLHLPPSSTADTGDASRVAFSLPGMVEAARQTATHSPHRSPRGSTPVRSYATPQVHRIITLMDVRGVVFSSADDKSVVLDFADADANDLWPLSIIAFAEKDHRDEFVGCLFTAQKRCAYATAGAFPVMYTATNAEPLLNMERAKRAVSAVRLRRAIDASYAERKGKKQALWINVEAEDYEDVGRYHDIVAMLRSQGDTTIKMSTAAEWIKDLNEGEHRTSHLLIITETSVYLLLNEEKSFRMDKGAGLQLKIGRIESATLEGNVITLTHSAKPRVAMLRILGTAAAISGDAAALRVAEHLQRIFLDARQGAMSLPLKHEKDTSQVGARKQSKLERAIRKLATGVEHLSRKRHKQKHAAPSLGDPNAQLDSSATVPVCYKWLLAIVRHNRMFDLIDTFNNIKATHLDNLKTRRLGLSLIALCDHLDVSHQLMYECVLYELMSCASKVDDGGDGEERPSKSLLEPTERDFASLFAKDSFPLRLMSLYMNKSADDYAHLVLTAPIEHVLANERPASQLDIERNASMFLEAFLEPASLAAAPRELEVIICMIQRAVREITDVGLVRCNLDTKRCIACFIIERLFGPAIQSPEALNINLKPTPSQRNVLSSTVTVMKAAMGYGATSFRSEQFLVDRECDIERYLEALTALGEACKTQGGASPRPQAAPQVQKPPPAVTPTSMSVLMVRRQSIIGGGPGLFQCPEMPDTDEAPSDDLTRQSVGGIRDEEVLPVLPNLASVHRALAHDVERIFVSATLRIEKLNAAIKSLNEQINEAYPFMSPTIMPVRLESRGAATTDGDSMSLSFAQQSQAATTTTPGEPLLLADRSSDQKISTPNLISRQFATGLPPTRVRKESVFRVPILKLPVPAMPGLATRQDSRHDPLNSTYNSTAAAVRAKRSVQFGIGWAGDTPRDDAIAGLCVVALVGAVGAHGVGLSYAAYTPARAAVVEEDIALLEAQLRKKHGEVKAMKRAVRDNKALLKNVRAAHHAKNSRSTGGDGGNMGDSISSNGGGEAGRGSDVMEACHSKTVRYLSHLNGGESRPVGADSDAGAEVPGSYASRQRSFRSKNYRVAEPAFMDSVYGAGWVGSGVDDGVPLTHAEWRRVCRGLRKFVGMQHDAESLSPGTVGAGAREGDDGSGTSSASASASSSSIDSGDLAGMAELLAMPLSTLSPRPRPQAVVPPPPSDYSSAAPGSPTSPLQQLASFTSQPDSVASATSPRVRITPNPGSPQRRATAVGWSPVADFTTSMTTEATPPQLGLPAAMLVRSVSPASRSRLMASPTATPVTLPSSAATPTTVAAADSGPLRMRRQRSGAMAVARSDSPPDLKEFMVHEAPRQRLQRASVVVAAQTVVKAAENAMPEEAPTATPARYHIKQPGLLDDGGAWGCGSRDDGDGDDDEDGLYGEWADASFLPG